MGVMAVLLLACTIFKLLCVCVFFIYGVTNLSGQFDGHTLMVTGAQLSGPQASAHLMLERVTGVFLLCPMAFTERLQMASRFSG